jgi:hypothetical protein
MSHLFLVPANENGIVTDQFIVNDLRVGLGAPLGFSDVFLYSHGWWTGPDLAMQDYNRFTIEMARCLMTVAQMAPAGSMPASALGIGIHWPSMLSEDTGAIINLFQAASFYTMEKRADNVGENAGYMLLRALFQADTPPKRIHLIGHSFGCKVVLASLQEILNDQATVPTPPDLQINVVLLQAATDNDDLEQDNVYGGIAAGFSKLRLLVTTSAEDKALNNAYPAAERLDVFRGKKARVALGAGGPSDAVIQLFGGAPAPLDIGPGFDRQTVVAAAASRLVIGDLTNAHRDRANPYKADVFSGHHSDVFLPAVYELIVGFLFGV